MRRLFVFLICAVLWLLCAPLCRAQPALTTISDTLYNIDGSLMDGNIIVTNTAFSVGGVPIARGARAFPGLTSGLASRVCGDISSSLREQDRGLIELILVSDGWVFRGLQGVHRT